MSWKTILTLVVAGLILVAAVVGIIYGVTTHTEPTFLHACFGTNGKVISYEDECPELEWRSDQIPIKLKSVGSSDQDDQLARALTAINQRAGFSLVAGIWGDDHSEPDAIITFDVPYEKGWFEQTGDVRHFKRPDGRLGAEAKIGNTPSDEVLYYVLQHEVLHIVALAHDDYSSSIMFPKVREAPTLKQAPRLSDYDVEALQKYKRGG